MSGWTCTGFLYRNMRRRTLSLSFCGVLRRAPMLYFYIAGFLFNLAVVLFGIIVEERGYTLLGVIGFIVILAIIIIEEIDSQGQEFNGYIRKTPINLDDLVRSLEAELGTVSAPWSLVKIKAQFIEGRTALFEIQGSRVPVRILAWDQGRCTVVHIGGLSRMNRSSIEAIRERVDQAVAKPMGTPP